jgi:phosphatidate cytidylyltransferase
MQDAAHLPADASKWRNLSLRIASAVVLIPIVLALTWLGSVWYALLVAAMAVFMAIEWAKLVHSLRPLQLGLHIMAALSAALLPLVAGVSAALCFIGLAWGASIVVRALSEKGHTFWSVLGVPYVAFSALSVILLRNDETFGVMAVYWLLFVVWGADTLAFVAGRKIGGPKLWPAISPRKTWAGLGGAIAGGVLCSVVFAIVTGLNGIWWLAGVGALLAVVEQAGDFFESALKRKAGVKDSSTLIPGHGGMLDRVDGLVAAAMTATLIGGFRSGFPTPAAGLLVWQ